MDEHLDSGCKECRDAVRIWSRVLDLAQKDCGYQPPSIPVRFVKSYFELSGVGKGHSRAAKVAHLVFDTFRQPLPAGVRSLQDTPRHLVYKAGALLIDMRFEPEGPKAPAYLAGQVVDRTNPTRGITDASVSIRSGAENVTQTKTNEFGEFQLELTQRSATGPELTLWIEAEVPILIPLRVFGVGGQPS